MFKMSKIIKKCVCRVCLQSDIDIFGSVSNIFNNSDGVPIYEKLNSIADLQIKPVDGLPDAICAECSQELDNALNFRSKCETSNKILLSTVDLLQDVDCNEENEIKEELEEYLDAGYIEQDNNGSVHNDSSPEEKFEIEIKSKPEYEIKAIIKPKPEFKSKAIDLKLECDDCGSVFKSKCKLRVHWKTVHLKEKLTCPICYTKFKTFKSRIEHDINRPPKCLLYDKINVTFEGKKKILHCKECVYTCKKLTYMSNHFNKHTGEKNYACTLCPKRYSQISGLILHRDSVHSTGISKQCKTCGEILPNRAKHAMHMTKHKDIYLSCKICNKQVKKSYMRVHLTTHSTERPYSCEVCGVTYKTLAAISTHIRIIHKGFKYSCNKCGYKSKSNTRINRHRRGHTDTNVACSLCGIFLDNELQLSIHMQRHNNRKFICCYCDKSYYKKDVLSKHIASKH